MKYQHAHDRLFIVNAGANHLSQEHSKSSKSISSGIQSNFVVERIYRAQNFQIEPITLCKDLFLDSEIIFLDQRQGVTGVTVVNFYHTVFLLKGQVIRQDH